MPEKLNFEESLQKLEEIAKYSHFEIKPMTFDGDGNLIPEEVKEKPAPKRRRFR